MVVCLIVLKPQLHMGAEGIFTPLLQASSWFKTQQTMLHATNPTNEKLTTILTYKVLCYWNKKQQYYKDLIESDWIIDFNDT